MKRILAAAAALALVLSACDSGGEPEPQEPVWYGRIRNSCAPNDAPVVAIGIGTTAYAGGAVLVREGRTLLERCRERPICG